MTLLTLLVYLVLGVLLAWPLLRGWQRLARKMGWISLVHIKPYQPRGKRKPTTPA